MAHLAGTQHELPEKLFPGSSEVKANAYPAQTVIRYFNQKAHQESLLGRLFDKQLLQRQLPSMHIDRLNKSLPSLQM